eukprot:s1080_g5.t2
MSLLPTTADGMAAPPIFDMAENDAAGSEVQMWLEELGLGRYFGLLQAEGFDDFRIIRRATEEDVSELVTLCAMPRLHERQLRRALRDLHHPKEAAAANGHIVGPEDEELVESNAGAGSPRSRGEPVPAAGSTWEVIGGRCAGGVLVRTAQDLKSPEASGRLGFRATVRELELVGTRLNFELVTGRGPKTGWVSIKVSGKDLLVRCSDPEVPSTCEATSDNEEPPELETHEDEEDEVLSVDDEVLTDTRTPKRWDEEVEEVEALSSESAEGLTQTGSMDSERARGDTRANGFDQLTKEVAEAMKVPFCKLISSEGLEISGDATVSGDEVTAVAVSLDPLLQMLGFDESFEAAATVPREDLEKMGLEFGRCLLSTACHHGGPGHLEGWLRVRWNSSIPTPPCFNSKKYLEVTHKQPLLPTGTRVTLRKAANTLGHVEEGSRDLKMIRDGAPLQREEKAELLRLPEAKEIDADSVYRTVRVAKYEPGDVQLEVEAVDQPCFHCSGAA